MGTDIHFKLETYEDGMWKDQPFQIVWEGRKPKFADRPIAPSVFANRNYNLFAILADVRNGHGFAGIRTGEGWPSIAANRGVPKDYQGEIPGDHSLTWMTLQELKEFGWDEVETYLYGVIPAADYETLTPGFPPKNYAGDVGGYDVKVYTPGEYAFAKRQQILAPHSYVRVSWRMTARAATYNWVGEVVPWLETVAAGRPLRLIIGFDS